MTGYFWGLPRFDDGRTFPLSQRSPMPRENSFSDSEGRSLTPDLDEDRGFAPASPTYTQFPRSEPQGPSPTSEYPPRARVSTNASRPRVIHPRDKFRSAVRKVIAMHRSTSMIANRGVGAEPGIDPRRSTADLEFGHVQSDCVIQVFDYSSVRSSIGTMTNKEFVDLMNDPLASEPEPWVKVRWINIGGLSWDVIKAVSIKYSMPSYMPPGISLTPSRLASTGLGRYFSHPLSDTVKGGLLPQTSIFAYSLPRAWRAGASRRKPFHLGCCSIHVDGRRPTILIPSSFH